MKFQDFECLPIRNGKLIPRGHAMSVEELDSSGLNGVTIDISKVDEYTVKYEPIPRFEAEGAVLKTAILCKTANGLIFTRQESYE
jgi:hypothetical protein